MKYPKYDEYESIYKRYFKRDVKELIELANVCETMVVLDLCGGNGRLTKALKDYTPNVDYVEQEKDMIPGYLSDYANVYNMSVQDFIKVAESRYDAVFCQQAINYWLKHIDINEFAKIFKTGAVFIFNTFNTKPDKKPMVKNYEIDNKAFLEISYLNDNVVNHIQIKEGHEPHFTKFDYISEEEFQELLGEYFNIEIINENKTAIYRCVRK